MFAADLARLTQMLPAQIEDVLGELVTRGLLTADGFSGLRQLVSQRNHSTRSAPRHRRRRGLFRNRMGGGAGRWSLWRPTPPVSESTAEERAAHEHVVEQWAWQLLRRWGVVFRDLLVREPGAPAGTNCCRFIADSRPAAKFAAAASLPAWRASNSPQPTRWASCEPSATRGSAAVDGGVRGRSAESRRNRDGPPARAEFCLEPRRVSRRRANGGTQGGRNHVVFATGR